MWFIASLIVACANDAIAKYLGNHINAWEITFFRFFFGTCTLLPLMLYYGKNTFKTRRLTLHIIRGILLFIGIYLWSYGLYIVPITTATIMSFTVPIFVLILAPIFLKERVTWSLWIATIIGFIGIIVTLQPDDWSLNNLVSFILVLASMLFGILDIMNKKYVTKESMLVMMFYPTLTSALLTILPTAYVWYTPTGSELALLLALGIGSNFLFYCLLKALSFIKVSVLAPFRYVELLISIGISYIVFHEAPSMNSYFGAAIIIPSTLFILYRQGFDEKT